MRCTSCLISSNTNFTDVKSKKINSNNSKINYSLTTKCKQSVNALKNLRGVGKKLISNAKFKTKKHVKK